MPQGGFVYHCIQYWTDKNTGDTKHIDIEIDFNIPIPPEDLVDLARDIAIERIRAIYGNGDSFDEVESWLTITDCEEEPNQ